MSAKFQHTAARRRLDRRHRKVGAAHCFNTQPPEGGWSPALDTLKIKGVSTHSRPKAAGVIHTLQKYLKQQFQHTAARRRLAEKPQPHIITAEVSTHSRPKAAGQDGVATGFKRLVSTHSRPKAAGNSTVQDDFLILVSTHSRPKAAGFEQAVHEQAAGEFQHTAARRRLAFAFCSGALVEPGFNTQPPEGGWMRYFWDYCENSPFQHTAARRRLVPALCKAVIRYNVSTHSRPKAAGGGLRRTCRYCAVSTHSRPKAAGSIAKIASRRSRVSTHSRPKAAGSASSRIPRKNLFQHTAARRRLVLEVDFFVVIGLVSTHSRPKAAGSPCENVIFFNDVSTHSRPKAAGAVCFVCRCLTVVSTHSRPKAAGR